MDFGDFGRIGKDFCSQISSIWANSGPTSINFGRPKLAGFGPYVAHIGNKLGKALATHSPPCPKYCPHSGIAMPSSETGGVPILEKVVDIQKQHEQGMDNNAAKPNLDRWHGWLVCFRGFRIAPEIAPDYGEDGRIRNSAPLYPKPLCASCNECQCVLVGSGLCSPCALHP